MTNQNISEILISTLKDPEIRKFEENFLEHSVKQRMKSLNLSDTVSYIDTLSQSSQERDHFAQSLLVGFSEFFRNPVTYAILGKIILPGLIESVRSNGNKEIRIWSAACAGGQEAYSLAMILDELYQMTNGCFNYRIFATDINPAMISFAKRGVYDAQQLGKVPYKYVNSYTHRSGNHYTILPFVAEKVLFSEFDLLSPGLYCPPACIYGDFDVVLCCNILFYYNDDIRQNILKKAAKCLKPDGFLVTGETERALIPARSFKEVYTPSAIFIKKNLL